MAIIARHVTITGSVQGVFYRGWSIRTARSLGLTGWVRNRLDGHVEALLQGEQAAVETFLDLARSGPAAARVEHVQAQPAEIGDFDGFEQRPTC